MRRATVVCGRRPRRYPTARGLAGSPMRNMMAAIPLVTGFALGVPDSGAAQAPRLTLEQALDIASRSNPGYRKALNDLDLAGPTARQAWGAFLPGLSLSLNTGYSFTQRRVGTDDFGNPVPNPNAERRWNSSAGQAMSADVTVFQGGSRFHALTEVRAQAEAGEWTTRAELIRITADVSRQFHRAQRQQELVELERDLLAGREQDLEATRRLFEIAAKSQTDLLGAELEVNRQRRALQDSESERLKALEALRVAVGDREVGIEGGVTGELPDVGDLGWLDEDALVGRALEAHPALRALTAQERAAASGLGAARGGRWPTVTLGADLNRSGFGPRTEFLFDPSPDQSRFGGLRIGIQIPLFQNFRTSYEIASADVRLRNAGEDLRQERLLVEQRVREAAIDLRSRAQQRELMAALRDLADRRLALVREEYRLAVADFEALQNAVREAASARRDEINARFDLVDALITLDEVVGAPSSPSPPGS